MLKRCLSVVGVGTAILSCAAPVFAQKCAKSHQNAGVTVQLHQAVCQEHSRVVAVSTDAAQNAKGTIVDIAANNSDFSTLVAAVKAAGLVETLSGKGPFTVFAPTNAAFAKLPEGTVANLLKPENKDQLVSILTYHVVPGRVKASDVVKITEAKTVQGQSISVKAAGGKVTLNGTSQVVKTDIEASNGVIHVIDSVILPPAKTEPTIVEIAAGNSDFSTLVAAVKAAGLVETLSGEGPFTVFAPTNAAFSKLPAETLASLLKPENKDKLSAILKYHVVSGKVMASEVVGLKAAKTVQGQSVSISTVEGKVVLNGQSQVVKTDIAGGNGVIHVIDTVLLPE